MNDMRNFSPGEVLVWSIASPCAGAERAQWFQPSASQFGYDAPSVLVVGE
jgi:hypothetical protein